MANQKKKREKEGTDSRLEVKVKEDMDALHGCCTTVYFYVLKTFLEILPLCLCKDLIGKKNDLVDR